MFAVKKVSEPIYPTQSVLPTDRAIIDEGDMTRAVRTKHSRKYVSASQFTACSNTCAIRVGEIAIVTLPKMKDVFFTDLGAFLVTEIEHIVENNNNHYKNTFTGIVGATETLPDDHIVMPVALPEPAIVVDNNDPKKQGRVKVRYFWQDSIDKSASTNWIRVQTPDAGKSDNVPTNRGMWFIPEKDDQVMIGFEKGDPSRPYVMGSLFHRDNTRGIAEQNNIRSIITPKGSTISFDDGVPSISIFTTKGNRVMINEKSGTITVNSENLVEVKTKDVVIDATDNMSINVGKNFDMTVGGDSVVSIRGGHILSVAKNVSATISGDTNITVEQDMKLKTKETLKVSTKDTSFEASGKMRIASKKKMSIQSSDIVDVAKG